MKHIESYKIFENRIVNFFRDSKIKSICKKYDIRNYTINDDGSIDVDGEVDLYYKRLTKLPLKFNKINGWFDCGNNKLTTLEGSPKYVGGNFYCSYNKLTSLEDSPKYVGRCLDCRDNKITSLEECPEYIGNEFQCDDNPIYSVVKYFINRYDDKNNLIELFNYYDIVQDMNVIYDRLKFFYDGIDTIGITDRMLKDIEKKGYKIIR